LHVHARWRNLDHLAPGPVTPAEHGNVLTNHQCGQPCPSLLPILLPEFSADIVFALTFKAIAILMLFVVTIPAAAAFVSFVLFLFFISFGRQPPSRNSKHSEDDTSYLDFGHQASLVFRIRPKFVRFSFR
jgi:hypothetical protein